MAAQLVFFSALINYCYYEDTQLQKSDGDLKTANKKKIMLHLMSLHIFHVWTTKCKGDRQKHVFCQALNKTLVSATDMLSALQFVCDIFGNRTEPHCHYSKTSGLQQLRTFQEFSQQRIGSQRTRRSLISRAGFFTHSPVNMCGRS